jgi:hypothetical protein
MLDALSERTDLLDHDARAKLLDLQFRLLGATPILGIYVKWEVGPQGARLACRHLTGCIRPART